MVRRILHLLLSCHLAPIRAFRRRISVQLIASYVAVVLLSVLILEAAAIASLFGYFPSFLPEEATYLDFTMGEKARAVVFRLGSEDIARVTSGEASPAERTALHAQLVEMIDADNTGGLAERQPLVLDGLAKIAIVDATGQIVASTDESWAAPGSPIAETAFPPVVTVTQLVIAHEGMPFPDFHERYAVEVRDRITASAYPVLTSNGDLVGVVAVQRWPMNLQEFVSLREVIKEAVPGNLRYFWIVAVPALLVSIPFGVWRARTVSKRLSALADAAEGMARGDVSRRVAIVGQDEISRVGRRFNEMADRLTAVDRTRKSFAANVSHELRTPIAIIQGNLERLVDRATAAPSGEAAKPAETGQDVETLRVVHQEAMTLSRLIDDLFTLTRLEDSALPIEVARVKVDEAATHAVGGLKALAWAQRKVTVESVVQPGLPPVRADLTRLQQILTNLLYNALRHTPEGGLIIVDAMVREHDIEVSVTDTGVGIPPEKLDTIFDRYYAAKRENGRGAEGAGLGLHLVKQLVEAQGGVIAIESATDRGTTVRFTLPLA